jgi:hypothetical protein
MFPRGMVCLRNISVATLYKGDTEDDDDNTYLLTDKTILFKRPDITFINKKTMNTFLIDIAVPNTHNLAKTITDKQNK